MARTRQRRREAMPEANVHRIGDRTEKVDPAEPTYAGRRPGRPTKLTPAVEKRFMDCVKAGGHLAACARYVGLPPDTVEKWLKRGRGVLKGSPPTPEYVRFARLVDEARVVPEIIVAGSIVARAKVDPQMARLFLNADPERRRRWFPKDEEVTSEGEWEEHGILPRPPVVEPRMIDNRTQVIVLSPERTDALIGGLLTEQREQRAARLAAQSRSVIEEPQHGTRITRLDGLRVAPAVADDD